jgi:glycosyltransferase involved in cell wall biosynthesis
MNNRNILIVSQPFFPVPSVNDGAIPFVIEDTIACIENLNYQVISIWDERIDTVKFNKSRFVFIKRKSIPHRIVKRLLSKIIFSILPFPLPFTKYIDMFFGILRFSIFNRPKVLVIHSTRCEWIINLHKFFSFLNIKVVWYHHMSEDQETDNNHLRLFPGIDAHIFVSDHSRIKFIEKVKKFDQKVIDKSYVIKNGVNNNFFRYDPDLRHVTRNQYEISPDDVVVLFIGKLIPRKGFSVLLDAFSLLPEGVRNKTVLFAVGAADYYNNEITHYRTEVEQKAKNNEAKIIFTGYVPHKNILGYYCAADLLVFPSIEEEGMPLTILEAQSVGLPIIASDVGGIPEVIITGETGFVYSHDSKPEEISGYLEKLCESHDLRRQFSQRAVENISKNYLRERMAQDFEKVMSKILNDK